MAGLTKEVHDMGLKLGIYSTPWGGTYSAHIGSYSDNPDGINQYIKDGLHNENYRYQKPNGDYWVDRRENYVLGEYSFVEADVKQWADWEVDYLKYDWSPLSYYHTKEMYGCNIVIAGVRQAIYEIIGIAFLRLVSHRISGLLIVNQVHGQMLIC